MLALSLTSSALDEGLIFPILPDYEKVIWQLLFIHAVMVAEAKAMICKSNCFFHLPWHMMTFRLLKLNAFTCLVVVHNKQ